MKKQRLPVFVWLFLAVRFAVRALLYALPALLSLGATVSIPILMFRLDWSRGVEFLFWSCGLPICLLLLLKAWELLTEHWDSFAEFRKRVVNNTTWRFLHRVLLQNDPSAEVRKAATQNETDGCLLQAAVFDPDVLVRLSAAQHIQEENLFRAAIVGSGADEGVLKAATTRKLSNLSQRLLVGVALESENPRARALAAEGVNEIPLTQQLLRESKDANVRKTALQNIKKSGRWAEILPHSMLLALRDPDPSVRKAAAGLLRDLRYAKPLVRLSGDDAVRAVAAAFMGEFELDSADQTLLLNAALGTQEVELQRAAAKGIRDAGMLQTLLERLDDSDVRRTAMECIRRNSIVLERPEVFLTIALESYNESIRKMAANLVTDPALISRLLRESEDEKLREQALLRTQEQADFAWSARNDASRYLRDLAMDRVVSFQERLDIACASSDVSFAGKYLAILLAKAIRDGGIPPEMEGRIRRATCAEELLDMAVCPDCGGLVSLETEYEYFEDEYNGEPYSDWRPNILGYRCSGCCKLSDLDPSIPLDRFLRTHRKTA